MTLPRLFVLGDSISIQYGPYLEQYVAGRFQCARKTGTEPALQRLDPAHNANGGDSGHVLHYLRAMQQHGGLPADLLFFNCGLHDIKTDPTTGEKQVSPESYEDNLRSIVQVVGDMGLQMIWVRTTPCNEGVHNRPEMQFYRFAADCQAYNAIADGIMHDTAIPSIDLHAFTRNLGDDLYCDHVHFHDHIREKQAAYIAGWLQAWLATRDKVNQIS